jgi:hypothetical protein
VALAPGIYVIGAFYPDSPRDALQADDFALSNPAITFLHNSILVAGSLTFPTGTSIVPGASFFGPDFTIGTAQVVPEPATVVALAAGLGALLLARGRRTAAVRDR